jgi:hypothetical protein
MDPESWIVVPTADEVRTGYAPSYEPLMHGRATAMNLCYTRHASQMCDKISPFLG